MAQIKMETQQNLDQTLMEKCKLMKIPKEIRNMRVMIVREKRQRPGKYQIIQQESKQNQRQTSQLSCLITICTRTILTKRGTLIQKRRQEMRRYAVESSLRGNQRSKSKRKKLRMQQVRMMTVSFHWTRMHHQLGILRVASRPMQVYSNP